MRIGPPAPATPDLWSPAVPRRRRTVPRVGCDKYTTDGAVRLGEEPGKNAAAATPRKGRLRRTDYRRMRRSATSRKCSGRPRMRRPSKHGDAPRGTATRTCAGGADESHTTCRAAPAAERTLLPSGLWIDGSGRPAPVDERPRPAPGAGDERKCYEALPATEGVGTPSGRRTTNIFRSFSVRKTSVSCRRGSTSARL